MQSLEDIYSALFNFRKLERDKGVTLLSQFLKDADPETIKSIEDVLLEHFDKDTTKWELKHGAFLGAKAIIIYLKEKQVDEKTVLFLKSCQKICIENLTDSEVRIRLVAGEVLGSLCLLKGTKIYEECHEDVLKLIKDNMERDLMDTNDENTEVFSSSEDVRSTGIPRTRRLSSDAAQIFHDTAGWKFLETSMKCLQFMVDGCGENFKPFITNDFLELLFKTLAHTNRFVRETGYYVLGSLISCGTSCEGSSINMFSADQFGHQISNQLGIGLSDNWSQVRLASSECARKFLLTFEDEKEREVFYPELLPKLCLNRYYIADGVRIYSQESWQKIVKDKGRMFVKQYIDNFVKHYISQTKADNHAVREAACACIAELASKVERESVQPYVPELLQTLIECFGDDSWPVRDAACLACGNFILCFPDDAKPLLPTLYPLFFRNLKDCISSVRQGAAGALANVVRAYGLEAYKVIKPEIVKGLKGVKNQAQESEKYTSVDKGPALFSVVKKLRDNDVDLHSNQQMYSCGSLAPKMGRGSGCSDHKFRKPPEPFEFADGCIHLTAELSQFSDLAEHLHELILLLHEAVGHKHYTHYVVLYESLCKLLPNICRGIGKKKFKQYLDMFIIDIFVALGSENVLTLTAASQCLCALCHMIGPNILRARLANLSPVYVQVLDSTLKEYQ